MNHRRWWPYVLVLGMVVAGLWLVAAKGRVRIIRQWIPRPTSAPDARKNPLYADYRFGTGSNVVDVGIQPRYLPPCIITEAMKRDRVLQRTLADMGVQIRFHPFLKGADVNSFLFSGELEAGIGGDMPALTAIARHNAVVVAMIQRGFCSIISTRQMLVRELKGKRVGIALGSNAHYALLMALSSEGLGEKSIVPVPMEVTTMASALANGEIDAFAAWEPASTLAVKTHPDQHVIHRVMSSGFLYFSPEFYEQHRPAVIAIVESLLRAVRWMREDANLRTAITWVESSGGNPPDHEMLTIDDYVQLARADLLSRNASCSIPLRDTSPGGRLAHEFSFLQDEGAIPKSATWEDVLDNLDMSLVDDVLDGIPANDSAIDYVHY